MSILKKVVATVATAGLTTVLFCAVGASSVAAFPHQQAPNMVARKVAVNEARFDEVVAKLEADVVEYARLMESLYETRCEEIQLEQCANGNYYECFSQYPQEECLSGTSFHVEACGDEDSNCSGLHDFSISTVRLLSDSYANPDPQVVETVCYTAAMDEWLQAKREADASFWEPLGVEPRGFYFGSTTGAFRLWPARHSDQCGAFDPRIRPWYVAASSGPKNIIMVLDTSGSMKGIRMTLLQEAAARVVNTLTVGDRVAIVPFSGKASKIVDEDGFMFVATDENKAQLVDSIHNLKAEGATNFYDALTTAFDVLDDSAALEFTVNCNTAILFLTDGEMTEPGGIDDDDVLELVSRRLEISNQRLSKPIVLFTYSVSELDAVHALPKKMACSTDFGVWSKVTVDADIVESLSGYYKFFALGLGSGQNEDFVAWVEPYQFASGGTWGTSVSVPVYDRSKSPPLFLGVVAVDVGLAALDNALGVTSVDGSDGGSQESIERIALTAVARCPVLSLDTCELESFRRSGNAGDDALCWNNCTDAEFVQVEAEQCSTVSDYPTELFVSPDLEGLSYEERVCCKVGETAPSNDCGIEDLSTPSDSSSVGTIVGAAVGGLAGLCIVGCIAYYFSKGQTSPATQKQEEPMKEKPVVVLPPPTAPHHSQLRSS
eukprot:Nitzschia sp. Nitz4//scaffold26_size159584//86339//88449//NITZ4_002497-RA/size159584-snap-gene-0.34-mRNA-1//-1//CDS//3329545100//711//frame0